MNKKDPPKIPLLEILGLVRFLKEGGRADAIAQKAKAAGELVASMQDEARRGRRDHYTAMAMIEITSHNLGIDVARARHAEEELRRLGWKMNNAGKVSRIRKGSRGADLLAECVWELYVRDHTKKGNTAYIRRKIAAALDSFFDAAELNPASDGPIYTAIYNRENRSR